jgi:hypothetical protein
LTRPVRAGPSRILDPASKRLESPRPDFYAFT